MKLTKRQRRYLNRETRKLLPEPMSELIPSARIILTVGYCEPKDGGQNEYIYHEKIASEEGKQ